MAEMPMEGLVGEVSTRVSRMAETPTIVSILTDRAQASPADTARELEKAAKKIGSYSRAPGKRKDAERVTSVLTPAVVEALGDAFIAVRTYELDNPLPLLGPDFRQADHAFAALLIGAADPALEAMALRGVDQVVALLPRMSAKQAEHIHYLAKQFPEVEAANRLHAAAKGVLAQFPETAGEAWARELGLDLPNEYWSISLGLDPVVADTEETRRRPRRWFEAIILADITSYPGDHTTWSIRIGTTNRDMLGWDRAAPQERGVPVGTYDREDRAPYERIAGAVVPPQSPSEFPRVLADLEAAHPELRYDYAKLSVSGSPGRLLSPAKKKLLIAWLSRANG